MRAMPRAFCRPRIPVTDAPAGPESRHPPDPAGTRGIARMARSYGGGQVNVRAAATASGGCMCGSTPRHGAGKASRNNCA